MARTLSTITIAAALCGLARKIGSAWKDRQPTGNRPGHTAAHPPQPVRTDLDRAGTAAARAGRFLDRPLPTRQRVEQRRVAGVAASAGLTDSPSRALPASVGPPRRRGQEDQ